MAWKWWLVVIGLLLVAVAADAQTTISRGPLQAGDKLAWSMPANVTTPADALSFEFRLARNGAPLSALVNATCAPSGGSSIACEAALTASNLDALNQVGVWSLTLTIYRSDVGESAASDPFVLTSPAGAPTGVRIIR
jgi:hypothetical protein